MIQFNMTKAKEISHNIRREVRAQEFAPLDQQININIANPTKIAEIEAQRQEIRDRYAVVQTEIDSANDAAGLKSILESIRN